MLVPNTAVALQQPQDIRLVYLMNDAIGKLSGIPRKPRLQGLIWKIMKENWKQKLDKSEGRYVYLRYTEDAAMYVIFKDLELEVSYMITVETETFWVKDMNI